MTNPTELPAASGGGFFHEFVGDIAAFFMSFFNSSQFLMQIAAIVLAVIFGLCVSRLIGARIKAHALEMQLEGWKRTLSVLALNTFCDILFSASAASIMSLCVWVLTNAGMVESRADLMLVRVAYQIFYAWAILLVLMQFLGLVIGGRMFGLGIRRGVCVLFWILAVLQIMGVLPDIIEWMRSCQLPIGTDKLTVWALLVGIITLFLSLGVASRLSGLCENAIMNMQDMEMNIRVVIARLCHVAFLVLGVLVGLSSAGINLTILSVFGGAVGVGIGFGMQKIASNYISGFIILFDKSVKIGDLVEVANFSGIITQINTRYSVLRNTSGEEMIVPNENFVTGSVKNYSHSEAAVLVTIYVSCAYESNVDEALRLLLECVKEQPRVIQEEGRMPWVAVTDFAASGITLRASFWIADPREGTVGLKSSIMRAVLQSYKEAGIEIPYNKLDVTLKKTI